MRREKFFYEGGSVHSLYASYARCVEVNPVTLTPTTKCKPRRLGLSRCARVVAGQYYKGQQISTTLIRFIDSWRPPCDYPCTPVCRVCFAACAPRGSVGLQSYMLNT